MFAELLKQIDSIDAIVWDNSDEFLDRFATLKTFCELVSVSYNSSTCHFVYCDNEGQHFSDSAPLADVLTWISEKET